MSKDRLAVYSGECFQGVIGYPTTMVNAKGERLYIGDIVMVYHKMYPNLKFHPTASGHFTCVVDNRYKTYTDGKIENQDGSCFVMGIANVCEDCNLNNDEWSVITVKSYKDVIEGEHWKAFGFNYRKATDIEIELAKDTNEGGE